jgi:glucosamine--fructose-6-phosphate aminotransferase (isomerizing)
MCGIIGFFGFVREGQWGQTHSLLRELFIASEHRGQDATGFSALTSSFDSPKSQRLVTAKQPFPASDFVLSNTAFIRLRQLRCSAFIGHVRMATHGEPTDNANNHPFSGKDGLHLVHNGVVSNYLEIADKLALKLTSKCDSEILLRVLEASENPYFGLLSCIREVQGSMAVAVLDEQYKSVWLARNGGRPLWLGRLKDDRRWFFASEQSILVRAFSRVLGPRTIHQFDYLAPIPENAPLVLTEDGRLLAPGRGQA